MRKTLIAMSILMLSAPVLAADAEISPGSPEDIILNSSNNYEVPKEFDGSASTPDSATHLWSWEENSTTKTGEIVTFTFTRENSQTNTLKLTVTENQSAEDSVTQTLRDEPEITYTDVSNSSLDLKNSDGKVDLSVHAKNTFDGPLSYEWLFNNGTQVKTGANVTYDFDETGSYSLTVNVSDSKGYYSTKQVQTIDISNSSTNNNNQNNGENDSTTNQEAQQDSVKSHSSLFTSISPGDTEQVEPSSPEDFGVQKIELSVNEVLSSVEITINEKQDDQPSEVDSSPSREVSHYLNIESDIDDSSIDQATIEFTVDESWIEDNNIDKGKVRLERYHDNEWQELETSLTDEGSDELTYEADTPGFSYFAVTGEKVADTSDDDLQTQDTEDSGNQTDTGSNQTETQQDDDEDSQGGMGIIGIGLMIAAVLFIIAVVLFWKKDELQEMLEPEDKDEEDFNF